MSKKLNIIEAMKMPIGTEFKVQYTEGSIDSSKVTLNLLNGVKLLKWSSGNIVEASERILLKSRFIPIQQPVSFMEAIKNPIDNIRVDIKGLGGYLEPTIDLLNRYMTIGEMLRCLAENLTIIGIVDVIPNGKWYIEESEELEDERLS